MAVATTTVLHKGFHVPFVALWRYKIKSQSFDNYSQSVRKPKFPCTVFSFVVCLLLFGAGKTAQAAVILQTGIESGVNVSDNIALKGEGKESSDVVLQLKPTVSLVSKSRRSTVNVNYALQNLSYARNTDANSIYHQLDATGQASLVPKMLLLDTNISRTQFSSLPAVRSSFGNFSLSDRHNVTRASVSPTLKLHYVDALQGQINYLAGTVALDNVASSSNLHQLKAKFNSGKAFPRFRWQTNYNMVKEIRNDPNLQDINYSEAKASAEYAMFRGVYIKSEFGNFKSDYVSSRFASKDGHYQSYGLRYQPTRRVDMTALGGPDYRSASIDLKPTPRTQFNGFWHDSKFGLGFGNKASGAFSLKLRHVQWRLAYSDSLTSIQQIIITQDINNANLQTFQVSDSLFRQKQSSLGVTRQGKKIEANLKFFIDKREYEVSPGNIPANVAGVKTSLTWQLDGRLNMVASSHNEYRKTENDIKAGRLESFSLGLALKKRRNVSASLSYRYTVQSDPLGGSGGGYIENSILALASYMR